MKRLIKATALIFSIVFMLLLQSACSSENESLLVEDNYLINMNDEDTVDTYAIMSESADAESEPFEDPILEEENGLDDDLREFISFVRIDFDDIDFASMIIPPDTPHGYIGHWYVRHISTYFPSRVAFTYRELDIALWLEQMLYAKGFEESQVHVQTFSHDDVRIWQNYFRFGIPGLHEVKQQGWHDGHESREYSQNIIVTIPGRSSQTIIVGAHYDSLRYTGTSDNASGVALLMENAQRMMAKDNYYTLIYVFFGAHEVGTLGAFYFYHSLSPEERESIVLYINADILIEGPELFVSAGYDFQLSANPLSEKLLVFVESFGDSHEFIFNTGQMAGGDQFVFLDRGHTTLAFWGIDGSTFTNFLHSDRDSYEYISNRFPGMIERAMNAFALLLEAVLLEI